MNIPLLLNIASELYRFTAEKPEIPSDERVKIFFKQRSFLGKRDRKELARLYWHAIRYKSRFEWEMVQDISSTMNPRIAVEALMVRAYRDLYPDISGLSFNKEDEISRQWKYADMIDITADMPDYVRYALPLWIWEKLVLAVGKDNTRDVADGLLKKAGLHCRTNTLKINSQDLRQLYPEFDFMSGRILPETLRIRSGIDVQSHAVYKKGLIEIQDEGSQLIARAANPQKGQFMVDACAGAGGKTLHLAALTRNQSRIIATDKYPERLLELMSRARRADVKIEVMDQKEVFKTLTGQADILILDVPCTGSGTFRRRPDLKWKLTPDSLNEYVSLQRKILEENIPLLKPGGALIYATCSIFAEENEEQIEYICDKWPELKPVSVSEELLSQGIKLNVQSTPFLRINPNENDTDGYFIAKLVNNRIQSTVDSQQSTVDSQQSTVDSQQSEVDHP